MKKPQHTLDRSGNSYAQHQEWMSSDKNRQHGCYLRALTPLAPALAIQHCQQAKPIVDSRLAMLQLALYPKIFGTDVHSVDGTTRAERGISPASNSRRHHAIATLKQGVSCFPFVWLAAAPMGLSGEAWLETRVFQTILLQL